MAGKNNNTGSTTTTTVIERPVLEVMPGVQPGAAMEIYTPPEVAMAQHRAHGSEMSAALAEKVLVGGDLGELSPEERLEYILKLCQSLGLNPTTRPFAYLLLQNKLTLYARKDATEQLRKLHNVAITDVRQDRVEDMLIVTVKAQLPNGRPDVDLGVVSVAGMRGEALANAIMKAVTKGKRRVTLSICGLGVLDESEVDSIPNSRFLPNDGFTTEAILNTRTGELQAVPSAPKLPTQPQQQPHSQEGDLDAINLLRRTLATHINMLKTWNWAMERINGEYRVMIPSGAPSVSLTYEQLLPVVQHFEDLIRKPIEDKKAPTYPSQPPPEAAPSEEPTVDLQDLEF